jgi:hypothetical protein
MSLPKLHSPDHGQGLFIAATVVGAITVVAAIAMVLVAITLR